MHFQDVRDIHGNSEYLSTDQSQFWAWVELELAHPECYECEQRAFRMPSKGKKTWFPIF